MAVLEPNDDSKDKAESSVNDVIGEIDISKLTPLKQLTYFRYTMEIDKVSGSQAKDLAKQFLYLYLYTQQTAMTISNTWGSSNNT